MIFGRNFTVSVGEGHGLDDDGKAAGVYGHEISCAKQSEKLEKAISCLVIVFVISLIIAPKTCRKRKQLFTARSLPVFCISSNARDIDISAVIKVMRNSTNVFIVDMHFHKRNEVVNAVFSWQSLMLSWEAGVSQLR